MKWADRRKNKNRKKLDYDNNDVVFTLLPTQHNKMNENTNKKNTKNNVCLSDVQRIRTKAESRKKTQE